MINTWVQGQETHADNIITTEASHTAVVNPVNDGVQYTVEAATGEENPGEPEKANLKLHGIEVKVTGDGLLDTDGSEEIYSILLEGVPNGFLVFMGNSPSDAAQAEPADNTGGSATNSWMLGSKLPKYIAIVPPKNWSGTVDGLKLTVNSGESELSEITSESFDFSLTVDPVANGVTLSPTASFGQEGKIIGFNLNASLEDLQQAGETDQHAELITLELDGLGEHAAFYIGDELISGTERVTDNGDGTYTIHGLSQDDVDNLGFIQAKSEVDSITVKAQSQEYEVGTDGKPDASKPVGNPSAWSDEKNGDYEYQ